MKTNAEAAGDCFARYYLRMAEMRESLRILEQAIENIPAGPLNVGLDERKVDVDHDPVGLEELDLEPGQVEAREFNGESLSQSREIIITERTNVERPTVTQENVGRERFGSHAGRV